MDLNEDEEYSKMLKELGVEKGGDGLDGLGYGDEEDLDDDALLG